MIRKSTEYYVGILRALNRLVDELESFANENEGAAEDDRLGTAARQKASSFGLTVSSFPVFRHW